MSQAPGSITLMGSGETSLMGGQVFEALARQLLARFSPPLQISVLETPAGFETNAQRVAGRVADFLNTRLQNYHPQIHLIAARKKGTPNSPDSPEVAQPVYGSHLIFFGPGSPTYTVRQLENSLTWQIIQARQRLGANLVLASAAIIALGAQALPVYEIYKVGEDVHWKPGLDFFQPYGLNLAIVPHWNNREGGDEVDTSRCFMGQARFADLLKLLPENMTIVGIDEHTALTIDPESQTCIVRGVGEVHIRRGDMQQDCAAGCSYPIFDLGPFHPLDDPGRGLPTEVWQKAQADQGTTGQDSSDGGADGEANDLAVPGEVEALVNQRQAARGAKDWALADRLRDAIADLGWEVKDTPAGPVIRRG